MDTNDQEKPEDLSRNRFVDYLCRVIVQARDFAESHPENSLSEARKAAEAICRHIHSEKIGEPDRIPLGELMKKLEGLIPERIAIILGTIQIYGNYAIHLQKELEKLPREFVTPSLSALAQVTNWFFREELRQDIPAQILESSPLENRMAFVFGYEY